MNSHETLFKNPNGNGGTYANPTKPRSLIANPTIICRIPSSCRNSTVYFPRYRRVGDAVAAAAAVAVAELDGIPEMFQTAPIVLTTF